MDQAYREKVYRLVYAVSQFPVLRQYVGAEGNDSVAELLQLLWGAGGTSTDPEMIMATLLRANADDAVRRLVEQADLNKVIEAGLQRGLYLTDTPPGLRWGGGTLRNVRSQAQSAMTLARSTTNALNERLASQSNALWFQVEAQELRSNTSAFEDDMRPLTTQGVDFFRESRVVDRAARQFLAAELGLATGILQVVVLDEETTSSNALAFRNAYARDLNATPSSVYQAYVDVMRKHDRVLRELHCLTQVALLTSTKDAPKEAYEALWASVGNTPAMTISFPGGRTQRVTLSNRTAKLPTPSYGSIFEMLTGLGKAVRKTMTQGSSEFWKSLSNRSMRYIDWLLGNVLDLSETAGKVFVFYIKSQRTGKKRMHPSWHMYANRDWREGQNNEDDAAIRAWIQRLLDEKKSPDYSPSENKKVEACTKVVERAANMLALPEDKREELVDLSCRQSGSCLDKQYLRVRDDAALTSSEDRSNQLARALLAYDTIGCGDRQLKNNQHLTQMLCSQRVERACEKTDKTACGAEFFKGKVAELTETLCAPESIYRKRISEKCPVPEAIGDGTQLARNDAQCIFDIAQEVSRKDATCLQQLETKCDEGREGWALVQALQKKQTPAPSPVELICTKDVHDIDLVKETLDALDKRTASQRTVCKKLLQVLKITSDLKLQQLVKTVLGSYVVCSEAMQSMSLDKDKLKGFQDDVDKLKIKQTKDDDKIRFWIAGGSVTSYDVYAEFKRNYEKNRIKDMDPDKGVQDCLEAVYTFIEKQSVGMEEVDSIALINGRTLSRYVHRMLYPKFVALLETAEMDEPPYYVQTIGTEYADWLLLVLDHFTKIKRGNLSQAIESARIVLKTANTYVASISNGRATSNPTPDPESNPDSRKGVARRNFFDDPGVIRHMYGRLASSVNDANAKPGGVASHLEVDLELIVRLNELTATPNWGSDDLAHGSTVLQELAPADVLRRRTFNADTLEKLVGDKASHVKWWRELLTMTSFAPRTSMADDFLQRMNEAQVTMQNMSFEQLYGALLCVASSAIEVQYAATLIVNAVQAKLTPEDETARDVIQNLEAETKRPKNALGTLSLFANIIRAIMTKDLKVEEIASENPKDTLYSMIRSTLEDGKDDPAQTQELETLMKTYRDIKKLTRKQRVSFARNDSMFNPLKLKQNLKKIGGSVGLAALFGVGAAFGAYAAGSAATSYVANSLAASSSWSSWLWGSSAATIAAEAAASTPVVGAEVAGAVAGATAGASVRSFWIRLRDKFVKDDGDESNAFFVLQSQSDLYTKMQVDDDVARTVLVLETALFMMLMSCGMWDKPIKNPLHLSELMHVARLNQFTATNMHDKEVAISLSDANNYSNLLPSNRIKYSNDATFGDLEIALILEYCTALFAALPVAIAAGGDLDTDEGFAKALFRVFVSDAMSAPTTLAIATPLQDFTHSQLFHYDSSKTSKAVRSVRRFHLYAVYALRTKMAYMPINKTDAGKVEEMLNVVKGSDTILTVFPMTAA